MYIYLMGYDAEGNVEKLRTGFANWEDAGLAGLIMLGLGQVKSYMVFCK